METEHSPTSGETAATQISRIAKTLKSQLETVIFGQGEAIDLLLVGLLSEGHILLEGLPGTAKTTLVKTLARLLSLDFNRIQLTPDMLPAEITGTSIYDLNTRSFSFKQGPIFTDLLLADEINRTPPKTQSALLEAMEEQQVTTDGQRNPLSPLFTVIATLNPVEFEGTFPLPEAQLDRFMMKINIGYPAAGAEKQMLSEFASHAGNRYLYQKALTPVASREDILHCRKLLGQIMVEDSLLDYILQIIQDTRQNPNIELGCSPRSALSLLAASRAHAAIEGQSFVTPDNVKAVTGAVIRHRLILTPEAELDELTPDHMVQQTLNKIPVPR
ncbi:AAA family ATPase [Vampirovibrio sp.]|uniref:AAA family ATPase n=1 Tax=Vampirovibrio sp. TaxID=2717857 RepID=UPI003593B8FA